MLAFSTAGDVVEPRLIGTSSAIVNGTMFIVGGMMISRPGIRVGFGLEAGLTAKSLELAQFAARPLFASICLALVVAACIRETYLAGLRFTPAQTPPDAFAPPAPEAAATLNGASPRNRPTLGLGNDLPRSRRSPGRTGTEHGRGSRPRPRRSGSCRYASCARRSPGPSQPSPPAGRCRTASCRRCAGPARRSRYWCRTCPASAPAGAGRRPARSR